MRWYIAIFLLCLLASAAAEPAAIRIVAPEPDIVAWLCERNVDWQYCGDDVLLLAEDELIKSLRARGAVCAPGLRQARTLDGYHSVAEVDAMLQQWASDHPNHTHLFSLGPSQGKLYYLAGGGAYADMQHDVWCMKVSDNPQIEEDEPNIYFMGLIHAHETISLEVVLHQMEHFIEGYGTDPEVTQLIDNNQIWFVPLINPDGYEVVWENLHSMHRKNMHDNNGNFTPDYSFDDGVDLNRNFGYVWGPNGASYDPSSSIYHGPEAWSEPETRYLRDLIRGREFWGGVTYHSQGQWVLYPLGHVPSANALDRAAMHELAVEMAESIPCAMGTGDHYTPAQAVNFGYTCQGTMGDWGYSEQRVFAFTIELARTYVPDASLVPTISQNNLEAALIMAHRIETATLTGHVYGDDRQPLPAVVEVHEIDHQSGCSPVEPVQADTLFGRFWRPLLPGSYTVTFSAPGYESATYNNVVINETGQTTLEVTLDYNNSVDDQPEPPAIGLQTWPNPVAHQVTIAYSPLQTKNAELAIYDVRGRLVRRLSPGRERTVWNFADEKGRLVASGVYLARLRDGKRSATHKILFLRGDR